jgi:hypothetical protein
MAIMGLGVTAKAMRRKFSILYAPGIFGIKIKIFEIKMFEFRCSGNLPFQKKYYTE